MPNYTILNGKLIKKENANISVFSKSMFFDFGVYESVKVIQGKIFFPDFHVARLLESAKTIKLEHSFKIEGILNWLNLLIKKNKLENAMIKFLLLGSGGKDEKPQLFLFPVGLTFYDRKYYKKGIKAITYTGERMIPNAKSKDLLLNFLALRKAQENNAKDALLIDSKGNIREGTRTNFFAIKNGVIYTPPLTDVLEGITRKIVVKLARKNNIKVVEEKISAKDIKNYDEFFITSTGMNIMPVTQIDDYIIGDKAGETTKILIKLFKDYYDKKILKI